MNHRSEWRLERRYDYYLVVRRIGSVMDERQIAIDDEANGDDRVQCRCVEPPLQQERFTKHTTFCS